MYQRSKMWSFPYHCSSRCILALLILLTVPLHAQQIPPEVAQYGYADTILVNGKVVSMDDKSTSTSVGRVYQAIAVKGDTIVKLGTSGEIRALAGPDTRVLDLKGRTLLPGILPVLSYKDEVCIRKDGQDVSKK